MNLTNCKSCKARIGLVQLDSGKWMPVDPEARKEPKTSMVAYNPRTRRGRVIRKDEVGDAHLWQFQGAKVYRSHFFSCPFADQHRRRSPAVQAAPELDQPDGPDGPEQLAL